MKASLPNPAKDKSLLAFLLCRMDTICFIGGYLTCCCNRQALLDTMLDRPSNPESSITVR